MANRLCKLSENIKRKKHSLYQYGIGIIFFVGLYIFTQESGQPLCLMQNLFGTACFGCGMTRGFLAILRFDYPAALEYNVLSIPLFYGIGVHALLLLVDIAFSKNYAAKFESILSYKWMYPLYGLLLIIGALSNNGILF